MPAKNGRNLTLKLAKECKNTHRYDFSKASGIKGSVCIPHSEMPDGPAKQISVTVRV